MKFLVDAMLGKLARFLRIFGYDTLFANDLIKEFDIDPIPDKQLLAFAKKSNRIIITKDYPFFKDADVIYIDCNNCYTYPGSNHGSLITTIPGANTESKFLTEWKKNTYLSYLIAPQLEKQYDISKHSYFDKFLAENSHHFWNPARGNQNCPRGLAFARSRGLSGEGGGHRPAPPDAGPGAGYLWYRAGLQFKSHDPGSGPF